MLSVVVFGVVCELADDDPYAPEFRYDPAPAPTRAAPQGAETPDPSTAWVHQPITGRRAERKGALAGIPRWRRPWEAYWHRRRRGAGISFTEFADLSDGRRAILRSDRGFSWSSRHSPSPWHGKTRESLTVEIRDYLAAEEEDCCPITPESVVELVQRYYDIEVDAPSVEAALTVPRRVEFGARILEELSRHEPPLGGRPSSGGAVA